MIFRKEKNQLQTYCQCSQVYSIWPTDSCQQKFDLFRRVHDVENSKMQSFKDQANPIYNEKKRDENIQVLSPFCVQNSFYENSLQQDYNKFIYFPGCLFNSLFTFGGFNQTINKYEDIQRFTVVYRAYESSQCPEVIPLNQLASKQMLLGFGLPPRTQMENIHRSNGDNQVASQNQQYVHEGKLVGIYTQKERSVKIKKYKEKLNRWRVINKDSFNGRSKVAKAKLRYFGRFIKSEDFKDKLVSDDQIIKNNQDIDHATEKGNYNSLVDLITQNPSEIK